MMRDQHTAAFSLLTLFIRQRSSTHDFSSALSLDEVSSLEAYFGYENGTLTYEAAVEGGFWPLVDPSLDIREWAKRRRGRRLLLTPSKAQVARSVPEQIGLVMASGNVGT